MGRFGGKVGGIVYCLIFIGVVDYLFNLFLDGNGGFATLSLPSYPDVEVGTVVNHVRELSFTFGSRSNVCSHLLSSR